MIVTTCNDVPGHSIVECIGIIRGIVVRSPGIGQGIMGGLKQIVGGNIEAYARVCESAREEAFERMVEHAREHGTDALVAKRYDAIVAMRYDATKFAPGVTEVLAYGTAVKLARDDGRA